MSQVFFFFSIFIEVLIANYADTKCVGVNCYIYLCGHYPDYSTEHFQHTRMGSPASQYPPPKRTIILTSLAINHINEITQQLFFCLWLLLLNIVSIRFIPVVTCGSIYFFALLCSSQLYEYNTTYTPERFLGHQE